MGKAIRNIFKNEMFSLTECTDGYYLWDNVLKMNIGMYCKTEQEAFIKRLDYYQRRLSEVKQDYKDLSSKVQTFVDQVVDQDKIYYYENTQ